MKVTHILLSFAAGMLQLASAAVLLPDLPLITPAPIYNPELARRDANTITSYSSIINDPQFIAWFDAGNGSTLAQWCDDTATWSSSGTLARCCDISSSCAQMESCIGTATMQGDDGNGYTCASPYACGTNTIYSSAEVSPVYNVICANPVIWNRWTMTRFLAVATTTSSSTSTTSSESSTTSSASSTSGTATATSSPSSSGSSSKAWIAGVVIGLVVIIAVAGLGFWFWRRRQNNANQSQPPGYNMVNQGPPQVYAKVQPHYGQYGPQPYPPHSPGQMPYSDSSQVPYSNQHYVHEADSHPVSLPAVELPAAGR